MNVTQAADKQTQVRNATTSLQNSLSRPKPEGGEGMGKDDFMKLLMAQVTHQDPLHPMDSQGMMNQLTTMGSLEQLINMNKQLGQMTQAQGDLAKASAYTFLDKDVTIRGGTAQVSGGANPGLHFDTVGEAESVKVNIADHTGAVVRTLDLGAQGPGRHAVDWDGRDKDGDPVPDGTYRYSVSAKSADKDDVPVDLISRGKVSGVRFEKGRTFLKVNGTEVDAREVIELSNRSQRLFGAMQPQPLRESLQPAPVSQERRR